ncbi:hypothetical protein R3P38DRAFT_3188894 [Favolaschia claudopus]|uniref:Uncharacterized protein n=1 Tax=Favolaschia claudopus TaxID=2862362 RepID=A0AAW0BTZ7_9AGAR
MPPKPWSSPEQDTFIAAWFPEYLLKKSQKKLDKFWPKLKEAWFSEFPEETVLDLPVQGIPHDPNATTQPRSLTDDERERLSNAIAKRFKQLRDKLYNIYAKAGGQRGGISRSAHSLAGTLFKKYPKRRRRHQVLEVYAKEYKVEVQKALDGAGFTELNEAFMCRDDDGAWVDDNDPDIRKKRVDAARSDRMKLYRRVLQECFDGANNEIQEEMRKKASEEVVRPKVATPKLSEAEDSEEGDDDVERTPEEYQLSIDEALGVLEIFFTVFRQMLGGWVGFVSCIGPIPRLGGKLGMKTHCFGRTTEGLTFEDYHSNFHKAIAYPLAKFARLAIPSEVRLARALYSLEDEHAIDEELADAEDQDTPAPSQQSGRSREKAKKKDQRKDKAKEKEQRKDKAKEKEKRNAADETSGGILPPPVRRPRTQKSVSSSQTSSTPISSSPTPVPPPSTHSSAPESFDASQSFDTAFSESGPSAPGPIPDPSPYNDLSASHSFDITSAASGTDIFPPGYDWTKDLIPNDEVGSFNVDGASDEPFGMPQPQHDGYAGLSNVRYPSFSDDDPLHGIYDGVGGGISDALLSDHRSSSSAGALTGTPSSFYLGSEVDFHADASVSDFLPPDWEEGPDLDPTYRLPSNSLSSNENTGEVSPAYAIAPSSHPISNPVPIGPTDPSTSSDSLLQSQAPFKAFPRPRPLDRTFSGPVEFGRKPQFRSIQSPSPGPFGPRSISAPHIRSSPLTQEPVCSSPPPPPSNATASSTSFPHAGSSQPPHSLVLGAARTSTPPSNPTAPSTSFPRAVPASSSEPPHSLVLAPARTSTPPSNPTAPSTSFPRAVPASSSEPPHSLVLAPARTSTPPSNPTAPSTSFPRAVPASSSQPPHSLVLAPARTSTPPFHPTAPSSSFPRAVPASSSQPPHSLVLESARTPPRSNPAAGSVSLPHTTSLESLPLRLRRMSTSPLPFPRSRPLANPPPPPRPDPPSPSTVALRMAAARQAKAKAKPRSKKAVKATSSSGKSVSGSANQSAGPSAAAGPSTIVPSATASRSGFKITLPAARSTAETANTGPPAAQPAPTYVYTTTNNNRRAAQEAAAKEKMAKEAAAAPKPGDIQVSYPAANGYNAVVVVPSSSRPRRQVSAPANRGEVMTLADRNRQAQAQDAEMVARLNGSKRKAEASGELSQETKK